MGLVFLAEDPSLNRQVAIKMLDIMADSEGDREFLRTRLLRDAKAAAILSHPNIVGVFDIVEEGQSVYVVMEYIEGESLASYLDTTPIPDHAFTLRVLQQVASGLDYTHSRGIVHRDIKPGNIMIGPNGVVKILDFGIARMTDVRTSTPTGLVMGTVDYMAPEQIKAAMIDGRADQFSLAAVAYRMICGTTLFGRHTLVTLAYKLVNESPRSVCEQNAATPAAVDHVLKMALAKAPADRYPNCSAFVDALTGAFSGAPVVPPPTVALPNEPPDAAPVTTPRRSKVTAAVVGVALVAAFGSAVVVWKLLDRGTNPAPVAARTHALPPVAKVPPGNSIGTSKPVEEPPKPAEKQTKPPAKVDVAVKPPATSQVSTPAKTASVTPPVPTKAPAVKKTEPPVKPPDKPPDKLVEHAEVVPPLPVAKEPEPPMITPDAVPSQTEPVPPAARETPFKRAQEAMQAKDYPAAIRGFTKVLETHPKMLQAYVDRGLAHQLSKQYPDAIQDYSDAIRLGSRDAHAYANRGVCEVKLHEDDLAFADFNRSLSLDQGFTPALNGRGGVFYRRKQYKLAINDFDAAIRVNPKFVQAYQNRAQARKATGDAAGAADDYAVIQRLQRNR
jgi:serine/threonine protein kinase/Tfp pilus assembly protein PilF